MLNYGVLKKNVFALHGWSMELINMEGFLLLDHKNGTLEKGLEPL